MDEPRTWLTTALSAGVSALGTFAIILTGWWNFRRDRAGKQADSRYQSEQALYKGLDEQLRSCWTRNNALETEAARMRADRDRGWDAARECHAMLHEWHHRWANALTILSSGRLRGEELETALRRYAPPEIPSIEKMADRGTITSGRKE